MIGLQLWLPFVFVTLFVLCYVNAFHSPAPHDVPVGVVGSQAESTLRSTLDHASPGGFDVRSVEAGAVEEQVRTGELSAVYEPGAAAGPTLVVASANGASTVEIMRGVFAPIAAAAGDTLVVDDVAPLPVSDSAGTAALYVSLVATIGGYMVGMFTGMMGGPLRRRVRFAVLGGAFLPLSLLAAVLVDPVLGVFPGKFFLLWLTMFAVMSAVGLTVNGLAYYTGRFVTAAALILFVFLNVPGSGGAIAADLLPEPFHALNNVVIGHGTVTLLRHEFYGAGPGVHIGIWMIASYAVVGLLLAVPGKPYAAWRQRRRVALGLPPGGMMAHAQHLQAAAAPALAAPAPRYRGRHETENGVDPAPAPAPQETGDDEEADVEASTAAAGAAAVG